MIRRIRLDPPPPMEQNLYRGQRLPEGIGSATEVGGRCLVCGATEAAAWRAALLDLDAATGVADLRDPRLPREARLVDVDAVVGWVCASGGCVERLERAAAAAWHADIIAGQNERIREARAASRRP